jgi:hypothetical protein
MATPAPYLRLDLMTTVAEILRMSSTDKIAEGMRRSLPFVPATARSTVEAMLRPETLAIVAGTLVVWAGSHFIGIGEIVDVILLTVGVVTLGFAVFEGADELYQFAKGALAARTEGELDEAGRHFARAITLLGISTIQAVLLRGQGRAVLARGRPQVLPRINPGTPPPAGNQLRLSRPARLSGGTLGETDAYGAISVARNQPLSEQRLTLLHELVHRYFSPRTGPLRRLRAELNISGYSRSALLRYLEEALAEGYAQLRVHGLEKALAAYRFPLAGPYPYVTVSQLIGEGQAIGTIMLGGTLFYVSITQ